MAKISVMGTGSWGTALAILLHNNGHQVMLWSAHPEKAVSLNETREDSGKLPGVRMRRQPLIHRMWLYLHLRLPICVRSAEDFPHWYARTRSL